MPKLNNQPVDNNPSENITSRYKHQNNKNNSYNNNKNHYRYRNNYNINKNNNKNNQTHLKRRIFYDFFIDSIYFFSITLLLFILYKVFF